MEPVGSPLGNPDSLTHLIDWTLDEIYAGIADPLSRQRGDHHRERETERPACACGENPLLGYFSAGGQAMREALVLAQVATANLDPLERDVSFQELNLVLEQISRREIEAFCSVCRLRNGGHPTGAASAHRAHDGLDGL